MKCQLVRDSREDRIDHICQGLTCDLEIYFIRLRGGKLHKDMAYSCFNCFTSLYYKFLFSCYNYDITSLYYKFLFHVILFFL